MYSESIPPEGSLVTVVTGGTGSFGSAVTKALLDRGDTREVRVLSRDESKQDDLRRWHSDPRLRFYIGDVRDPKSVNEAIRGADRVFHAAALKQVPSCEFFPQQAVATNILGTENVLRAADEQGVKSVVCLSTDKAVYPINAMGMSKALMEKLVQAFARNNPNSQTVVSCVRYGNVMYSRGSVIPLFVEQLKAGRELTLTNPEMTRFLMSIRESIELVQYALENAVTGDLFVKKAPAATIGDLASAVGRQLGIVPMTRVIGGRHGEKLYETLLSVEELGRAEDHGDYFRVPLDARSLDYSLYTSEGSVKGDRSEDYNSHNTTRLTVDEVTNLLATLPEFQFARSQRSS